MIRELPEFLINQIAAGEVVERPASVVKELIENALDAGASQIVIDVADGGRTMISVIDNGSGMSPENLAKSILRHATSKLPGDDLLNINFMGFRGEALPSIASVSDMTIDTREKDDGRGMMDEVVFPSSIIHHPSSIGYTLDCTTGEIKPSSWESGTRIRVANLFAKTPARLKFLRGDRAEMMSIVEVVKRLAMARPDVGFVLNNRWRFPAGQSLQDRVIAVMGDEVRGRMLEIKSEGRRTQSAGESLDFRAQSLDNGKSGQSSKNLNNNQDLESLNSKLSTLKSSSSCALPPSALSLYGYISEPTLRRASSIDQYLFVNGRPVKDKVLVGALRAAYMDVMSAREFPLCALYLEVAPNSVDVNVSPAKTEVHFLEPARVRGFIIKTLRDALATTIATQASPVSRGLGTRDLGLGKYTENNEPLDFNFKNTFTVRQPERGEIVNVQQPQSQVPSPQSLPPLGRVIGQIGNKYIVAENEQGFVIIDQHAAHERITYEKLRNRDIKTQPLLTPIIVNLKPEQVSAILEIKDEIKESGLNIDGFGDDAVAIFEKPADWDMDWAALLRDIANEVMSHGHSSKLAEKLHLKLANFACHHSVRAGQRLDYMQMDALVRDIENTERGGQCNHGRPVYKIVSISELDKMFERV